jgi:pimeloyl-ACP methyl ester carboxylesterase
VLALAAALALVLAVLVVVRVTRPAGPERVAAQDRPGPVLLVPGYGGGIGSLRLLAARLQDAGRDAEIVPALGNGQGDLVEQARALSRAAERRIAAGAPSVDVVGYSAGGVVARIWAADLGGDALARRIVTLGSPHHGTEVARLGAALAPQDCPEACRQLVPDSDLLSGLPRDVPGPRWVSLWTADDETVTPPASARLDDAVNVELQQVCPGVRVEHGQLPGDPLVQGLVLQALGTAGLQAAPPPSRCSALRAAVSS